MAIGDTGRASYYADCGAVKDTVQLIPPSLVPTVQALIASQGGNPGMINGNGELDAAGALGMLFNEVEVRTSLTPSLRFPISAGGAAPDPVMAQLISSLQPTVIFTGPAGRVEVAPYGAAQGASSWLPLAAIAGAVILGIGWLVWD